MIDFRKFKSFSQATKEILGYDYSNSRTKEELIKFCNERYGIDIVSTIKNNKEKPKYCLNCGKEIKHKNKFCSSSCAATYNNKLRPPVSEEQKKKVSETLKKFHIQKAKKENKIYSPKKCYIKKTCCICGKEFLTTTKTATHCSRECVKADEAINNAIREKALERVKNGTHKGWQTRNIKSYAENFWEKVLKENNIEFNRENFETKKYFLDFLIKKGKAKIDLEIDGKQHNIQERKEHDVERDKFLTENGYIVYRVKWNEIKTKKGKEIMKEKIDKFLDFYNNIEDLRNDAI